MQRFTRMPLISYEGLIHVIGTLVNDEHIFYAVMEEVFTEALLEWQTSKNVAAQTRIIKLTEIINSICELSSQGYVHGAGEQDTFGQVLRNIHGYDSYN